jgi:hypothetical protein
VEDAVDFARLAADPTRLAVLGQLALGARTAGEVAEATRLSLRDARRLLGRLCAGGLATESAGRYALDATALRALAARLTVTPPADPALLAGVDESDAVLAARYLRGSRLVEIPPSGGRRSAVLRVLVDEFLPGRYYAEPEVREVLRRFHPDDAALRRYLVEEGLLHRQDSSRTYWRGGGPPPGASAPGRRVD